MTTDEVKIDVSSIIAAMGYTPAVDEFDFEKQPSQRIDQVFRVRLKREGTVGEIGLGQIEEHRLECWLARQAGGAPSPDACRSLTVDLELVEARLQQFAITGDRWNVLDDTPETDVTQPPGADYVVGMLALSIDFDRDLSAV